MNADRASVTVVCADVRGPADSPGAAVDVSKLATLAERVLGSEGAVGELTLNFIDRADMAELNAQHMGGSGPTDVLSFPMLDDESPPDVPALLGDVVISPAVAADQFADHAGTLDDELALLVVHGILHVLGHDHAVEAEALAMRSREVELLSAHHWGGPPPAAFRQTHD